MGKRKPLSKDKTQRTLTFINAVHNAIINEDITALTDLLTTEEDILDVNQVVEDDQRSAIITAIFRRKKAVVEFLLVNGANLSLTTDKGHTVMYAAAEVGDLEIAQLLIRNHVDINKADTKGVNPCNIAAQNGHHHILELLLEHNGDYNKQCNEGSNALYRAVEKGHEEVADLLLLQRDCVVTGQDKTGHNLLHVAVITNHPSIAKKLFLLNAGLEELENNHGLKPSQLAGITPEMETALAEALTQRSFNPGFKNGSVQPPQPSIDVVPGVFSTEDGDDGVDDDSDTDDDEDGDNEAENNASLKKPRTK